MVNDNTDASIDTVDPLCVDGDAVTLTAATLGGTFSGDGVTGNEFDPSTAGVGTHEISYTVATGGCSATETLDIIVNALPDATIDAVVDLCLTDDPVILTAATTGGTFSGPGVTGNSFDPSTADVGNHAITYEITDGNGCSNTATTNIIVKACLLYTSPSPRDLSTSRMPSSA